MKPSELLDTKGKKLPAAWRKVLDRLVELRLLESGYDTQAKPSVELRNPFSGAVVKATPLCADVVGIILRTYSYESTIGERGWDYLRYTVNVCWPEVYYAIVD